MASKNDMLKESNSVGDLDERDFVSEQGDDTDFGSDLLTPVDGLEEAQEDAQDEVQEAEATNTAPAEPKAQDEEPARPRKSRKKKTAEQGTSAEKKEEPAAPALSSASRNPSLVSSETEDTSNIPTGIMRETAAMLHMEERDARQENATAKAKFNTALKRGLPLESTIAGVETVDREVYWVCYENSVTVRIPVQESFMVVPAELLANKRPATLERQRQFLAKAIGASISFVVTSYSVDPEDGTDVYYASRTQALAIERRRFFGKNAPRRVEEGQDVYGQIISLGPHSAYICCCGLDIRVENHALSHRYIEDVASDFYVGQTIKVRVVDIEEAPGKRPVMKVSARICELEKFRPNLKRVRENSRFNGTVTSIRVEHRADGPRVVVSLFLDNVNLPAFSRTMTLRTRDDLHTGDKVQFECYGYTPNGYVHGSIIRYIRSR